MSSTEGSDMSKICGWIMGGKDGTWKLMTSQWVSRIFVFTASQKWLATFSFFPKYKSEHEAAANCRRCELFLPLWYYKRHEIMKLETLGLVPFRAEIFLPEAVKKHSAQRKQMDSFSTSTTVSMCASGRLRNRKHPEKVHLTQSISVPNDILWKLFVEISIKGWN